MKYDPYSYQSRRYSDDDILMLALAPDYTTTGILVFVPEAYDESRSADFMSENYITNHYNDCVAYDADVCFGDGGCGAVGDAGGGWGGCGGCGGGGCGGAGCGGGGCGGGCGGCGG